MKFYLTEENNLRVVSADGKSVAWLTDSGAWEVTPEIGHMAKIERPNTVPLLAPEEALIAPWTGPGDNSPPSEKRDYALDSFAAERHMARRAGRNL